MKAVLVTRAQHDSEISACSRAITSTCDESRLWTSHLVLADEAPANSVDKCSASAGSAGKSHTCIQKENPNITALKINMQNCVQTQPGQYKDDIPVPLSHTLMRMYDLSELTCTFERNSCVRDTALDRKFQACRVAACHLLPCAPSQD